METDRERPHRSTSSNSSSTSELFVCFTSRLSSSSMKLSSKSILSPSRSRDPPQISLSSSLSRRLKSNGSMKGGQASPMFPTAGKRRGCGFENPEPSSPKVTCIGQVRVKTKKQGKKIRARSKRRGEASFRKAEQGGANANGNANPNADLTRQNSQGFQHHQNCLKHRNQRWVHLPLTICEALREFSCFFPCRSSCMSSEKKDKGGGMEGGGLVREGSCGNGLGRWLVALQDGDGKGRGIELVMEKEMEDERERGERSHSQRRHVFEDVDVDLVVGEEEEKKSQDVVGEEEEKARVSICIPPKNALLLMRCRSDPVKMAALANRFWESPVHKNKCQEEEKEGEEHDDDSGDEDEQEVEDDDDKEQPIKVKEDDQQLQEEEVEGETKEDTICERGTETMVVVCKEEEQAGKESYEIENGENLESNEFHEVKEEEEKDDLEANENAIDKGETLTHPEAHSDLDNLKTEEKEVNLQEGKEEVRENNESSELSSTSETFTASEPENDDAEPETEAVTTETSEVSTEEEEEKLTPESETQDPTRDPNSDPESKERENGSKCEDRGRETLPECLLLMMCEPKLSMEVSKETWVCSTDFIRWLPERPVPAGGGKRLTGETYTKSKPKPKPSPSLMQPPRSSCSFPAVGGAAGVSMATMIEQKLMGSKSGNGYEPFVLTRCKSEPMRSSAKLAPEACFWNNRKLEPHPPAAQLGVGAPAGVGF
ncbi:hypothetical protein PHAVU_005G069300 [Phaseolus vulgaris]|uniref:Uncharacterized protein n=1 Tax=Phaseolus vulgaris TaxID=3885 RepID=V7BTY4_PHAVU|nr:hypothetical protein PHAVU_005G069300g [Phaseolus vulgaris]ESW21419.1 hypothetical protein PHAVU_005G069300g [Phaseolus vulgaris]